MKNSMKLLFVGMSTISLWCGETIYSERKECYLMYNDETEEYYKVHDKNCNGDCALSTDRSISAIKRRSVVCNCCCSLKLRICGGSHVCGK